MTHRDQQRTGPGWGAGIGLGGYPMTSLQAGMVFHAELGVSSGAYHSLLTVTVRGPLDVAALTGALERAVALLACGRGRRLPAPIVRRRSDGSLTANS